MSVCHTPKCSRNAAALHHFLEVLPPSKSASCNPIGRELPEFDAYLECTCGFARNTRYQRTGIVRRFLTHQFGIGAIDLSRVTPGASEKLTLQIEQLELQLEDSEPSRAAKPISRVIFTLLRTVMLPLPFDLKDHEVMTSLAGKTFQSRKTRASVN